MDYWSVEVMYYDDGNQAFNTYMVKAQDQNDATRRIIALKRLILT